MILDVRNVHHRDDVAGGIGGFLLLLHAHDNTLNICRGGILLDAEDMPIFGVDINQDAELTSENRIVDQL